MYPGLLDASSGHAPGGPTTRLGEVRRVGGGRRPIDTGCCRGWRGGCLARCRGVLADRFLPERFRRALRRQCVAPCPRCASPAFGPLHEPCDRGLWTLSSAYEPREATTRRGKALGARPRDLRTRTIAREASHNCLFSPAITVTTANSTPDDHGTTRGPDRHPRSQSVRRRRDHGLDGRRPSAQGRLRPAHSTRIHGE